VAKKVSPPRPGGLSQVFTGRCSARAMAPGTVSGDLTIAEEFLVRSSNG